MPARKGLLAPQNTFLDTIATRFDGTHSNFVLGNAKITRIYPIVYCSDGFCELTGYSRAQIMQKSCACNFLYGQKTDVQHKESIGKSLSEKQELKLEVILYRSTGTPFWCLLDVVPIQDEKHEVVLFLCSYKDITKQKLHEQQQKVAAAAALHHQMQLHNAELHQQNQADHHLQQQQQQQQQQDRVKLTSDQQQQQQHADADGEQPHAKSGSDQLLGAGSNGQHQTTTANYSGDSQLLQQDGGPAAANFQQLTQEQLKQEHDDQQALISMEEFCIDELGDRNDDELDSQDDQDHDKHTANQYSRRRSRAVLYQLSGHYGYRRSVNMKSKLKLNNRMTIPEYKTTTIEKQKFILSHYGLGKSCWDWLILIVSFYVAIVVPYNATFKEKAPQVLLSRSRLAQSDNEEEDAAYLGRAATATTASGVHAEENSSSSSSLLASNQSTYSTSSNYYGNSYLSRQSNECEIDSIDIFVEIVFIIDVLLNFRTTFVNRKGEVVTRPKIICKHYVRGWFIVDACAALPFDLLCGLNLYSRSRLNLDLNLLKLIRLLRLARLLQKMDRYSQYSYIILTLLMLIFSLLAHWCACIWYVIAMEEIERHPPEWKLGWIHQLSDKLGYNVVNATDMASSYVTALYFTTSSLTSVGFGNVSANTNAEKIFSIVIMLIGALMHAVVFGNVTALIRVMYARRSNYQTRLRDLKDFFRLHQLPKDLQQRMSDYFQTTWSLNHGIETYEILKDFPEELRGDVSLHLHREVLSLPIFASAPQGFLKSLARHIESKFCCPTEYLIHRGDALGYLYLVCNGSMEVLQDNMVVGILGKGDLVGYDVNAMLAPDQQANQSHGSGGNSGGGAGGGPGGAGYMGGPHGSGSTSHLNHQGVKMMSMMGQCGLVKSSSDLKALTYCDLKCIHIGGLLEVLKLYPEFADTFHDEIIHDLSFNLREQHEDHDEDEEEDEEDDDDDEHEEEEDGDDDDGPGHGEDQGEGGHEQDDDDGAQHDDRRKNNNNGGNGGGGGSGGAGDDDDDDEENHDDEPPQPGRPQRQQRGSLDTPRSPPSGANRNQIGRLLRSITESGQEPDHIGRYDHEDDEAAEQTIAHAHGEHDEETETLDEENADDEVNEDEDGVEFSVEHEAGNDDRAVGPNNAEQQQQLVDRCDATSLKSEPPAARMAQARLAKRVRDENWQLFSNSYDGLASTHNPRTSRTIDGTREPASAGYDGVAERHRANLARIGKNIGSDDTVLELAQLKRATTSIGASTNGGGAVITTTTTTAATALRLKSAIGTTQMGGANRTSKPPISFDLSRNTTAIVDRRRRSAGCIQRFPLLGAASVPSVPGPGAGHSSGDSPPCTATSPRGARSVLSLAPSGGSANGKRCHSSLIYINESDETNQQQQMQQQQQRRQRDEAVAPMFPVAAAAAGNKNIRRRKSIERVDLRQTFSNGSNAIRGGGQLRAATATNTLQQQQQQVARQVQTQRPATAGGVRPSYSSQDLQQIDAHITASVRKLRLEFRQELNAAIEQLARLMLKRDERQQEEADEGRHLPVGGGARGRGMTTAQRLARDEQQQQQQRPLVQSTSSLTQEVRPRSRRKASNSSAENLGGHNENSMMARSISSASFSSHQQLPSASSPPVGGSKEGVASPQAVSPTTAQHRTVAAPRSSDNSGRVGQDAINCQQQVAASGGCGGGGGNQAAFLALNASDNDSGRSSTSVNSQPVAVRGGGGGGGQGSVDLNGNYRDDLKQRRQKQPGDECYKIDIRDGSPP